MTTVHVAEQVRVEEAPSRWRQLFAAREFPVALALVVVVVGTTLSNSNYLSDQGRTDLLVAVAITGLMAVGQTFVIVMRHVDLSVGSTLGLAAYLAASAVKANPSHGVLTILVVGLAAGLCVGLVNGVLVAWLRLPALVVTLGTLYVVQGLQAVIVGSHRIDASQLPSSVIRFGITSFLGIPWLMWVTFVAAAVGTWFMRTKRPGRDLYAVGSNPPAAGLVGIPVRRRTVMAFLVSGGCAGIAGALFLARLGAVDVNAGRGYELPVVAACVVGGVLISGGSGTVVGALLGAMLLKAIATSLSVLQVGEFWQQAVNGLLLLVAITADRLLSLRRERRALAEVEQ